MSFFAYPGRASDLVPADCSVTVLADSDQDVEMALEALAGQVAPETPTGADRAWRRRRRRSRGR